jgi:hypothetical protein
MPIKPIRVWMRNSDKNRSSLSLTSRFQLACMRAAARTARKTVSSNYLTPGIKPSYREIVVHARAQEKHCNSGIAAKNRELKRELVIGSLWQIGWLEMCYEQTAPPTVVL